MIEFLDILFLMGLGFSLAAPLGPVNMEMIKRSLKSKFGFILGLFTGLGAMTGDFIIATAVLFVGSEYLESIVTITWVYVILLILNIGILSFIGISAFRAPAPMNLEIENNYEPLEKSNGENVISNNDINYKSVTKQMLTGFAIVVTSPWSYFWWTSFGGYILNSGLPLGNTQERLIVTVFFLAGIFIWVLAFCLLLGISRRIASPRVLEIITKTTAVIILGFALKIFYDGIIYLST